MKSYVVDRKSSAYINRYRRADKKNLRVPTSYVLLKFSTTENGQGRKRVVRVSSNC